MRTSEARQTDRVSQAQFIAIIAAFLIVLAVISVWRPMTTRLIHGVPQVVTATAAP